MRITSNGNVGIGTSTPATLLHLSSLAPVIRLTDTDDSNVDHLINGSGSALVFSADANNELASSTLRFSVDGTERMRIDSSGNVLIGISTDIDTGDNGISLTTAGIVGLARYGRSGTGSNTHIQFYNGNGNVGTITTSGSATAYNTSSDYRLKENVTYDFDATTRLKQLKPARFNFIADADKTVDGFLAHEVQSVIPEAISGTKDETETKEKVVVNVDGNVIAENIEQADWEAGTIPDEDGNTRYPVDSTWEASKEVPVYQGIDQSKLTPILTKALQEAITKIEQLEARLTALES